MTHNKGASRSQEIRVSKAAHVSVRSTKQGRSLEGYPIVYGSQSEDLGGFVEVIKQGAIRFADPVAAIVDHNRERLLAKTGKNLTLTSDSTGVKMTIKPVPDTNEGRDILALADAGLITKMSFGFYPVADVWSTLSDGTPLRTITDALVFEVSVLTGNEPAYPATSVSARALQRAKSKRDDEDDDCDPEIDDDCEDEERAACSCTCQQCVSLRCDRCLMDSCTLEACSKNGCPAARATNKLRSKLSRHQAAAWRDSGKYSQMTDDQLRAVVNQKLNR